MPSHQNSNRTLYALTTAFTNIPATKFARMVKIQEDDTVSPQVGIAIKFPDDNGAFTLPAVTYPPAFEPVILGDEVAHGNALGEILGWPTQTGGNARAADIYCQVAAVAGTTTIIVTEIA